MKNDAKIMMIGDVKYKIKPQETDRYQIVTHALSYQVNRAILIYPKKFNSARSGVHRLGIIGPSSNEIEIFEYYFDLSGDLEQEELLLKASVGALMH